VIALSNAKTSVSFVREIPLALVKYSVHRGLKSSLLNFHSRILIRTVKASAFVNDL
jgi:hypothetical protein